MKDKAPNNPFLVAGYNSPNYFCGRELETEKIISALENDRNISLISPRRFGKTGLIHHVFYSLNEQNKSVNCFYLDIFSTQNLHEFVQLFGKTILGKLDEHAEKALKHISAFFKSFRPSLSYDSITGQPELSINIQMERAESSLQEIFAYLQQSGKKCYIAIDEFQQITEYPEKGVEALLRSYMQFSSNVQFIFAGSKKHLMDAMFSAVNRPFYQSTQKIGLKEIPQNTYADFAGKHFAKSKKTLKPELFGLIYNIVLGHTWYIQFILNQLYALQKTQYSELDVKNIIADVLEEENATYKTYCEMLTKGQLRLLTAIAKERKISNPFHFQFMKKHNLTAASSVKLALKSLIDKTLVLNDDGNYFVYDRFFSLWLEKIERI
ncbi:MAG: ATP-binding protein [Dysgonamonadaceae bacterium]|jgi:AAA+ ATPase superfamily predicted ATPase|nr:ATP-binding protein [Dysgonamonadaceae bacterium]